MLAADLRSTHPVDVLFERRGDLRLSLRDHPLQGGELLQPELQGPGPTAHVGLPSPPHRLPLHDHSVGRPLR